MDALDCNWPFRDGRVGMAVSRTERRRPMRRRQLGGPFIRSTVMLCLAGVLLAGCGKVVLYAKLPEQEGNEMLGLLLDQGIDGEKRPEKDDMVGLYVSSDQLSAAIDLLKRHGYPREQFSTISDIFASDKLISTPFEDHTRYLYGLSQEMAETLSQLDGVVTTRVHLVLPDSSDEDAPQTASASVFIKHNPSHRLDSYIPQIKSIVSSGIAELPYEAVTVALFPAHEGDVVEVSNVALKSVLSIDLSADSVTRFYVLIGVMAACIAGLALAIVYLFLFRRTPSKAGPEQ